MTTRKSTKASAAFANQSTVIDNDTQKVDDAKSDFAEAYAAFKDAMNPEATGAKNNVLRFISQVLLYAVGFTATIVCVGALSVAMQVAGWPLFLVMFCELVGYILGWWASMRASEALVAFVADGKLSATVSGAAGWVAGKFTSTSTFVKSTMGRTVH